jgi:hypothetical protein
MECLFCTHIESCSACNLALSINFCDTEREIFVVISDNEFRCVCRDFKCV